MSEVAERLATVRQRIEDAMRRRGPGPRVRLIGVSKRQPVPALVAAIKAGLRDLGENYAQELREKTEQLAQQLGDAERPTWHFIGGLQRNKVRHVVGTAVVHTADRVSLIDAIGQRAASVGVTQEVLVEVNLGGEAQKAGAGVAAVPAVLDAFAGHEHLRCIGLMIIPPAGDPEQTRPFFRQLARLRDELGATPRKNVDLRELSMGMSADFEVAILEGATMVRVGTALFGPRPL